MKVAYDAAIMINDLRIKEVLAEAGLPTDEATIALLREEVVRGEFYYSLKPQRWPTAEQGPSLIKAAETLLASRGEFDVGTTAFWDELDNYYRFVKLTTGRRLQYRDRLWLALAAANFLNLFRSLTDKPSRLHNRGAVESPALAFIQACCALIDPDVPASAIKRRVEAIERMAAADPR